nr:hypothetical protein StreXyl84_70240 [Streptomyces sp. Xyl84]
MSAPAPFPRLVAATVGVLVVLAAVGILVAAFGGAGGSATSGPGPSPTPTPRAVPGPSSHPTSRPTTPAPVASCLLYDFECQAEGGEGGPVPQPSTTPGRA